MKTDPGSYPLFRKYAKNPKKQYKWKFRISPSCLYSRLDRWLNRMSLLGWHIVDCKICFFLFEQGEPTVRNAVILTAALLIGVLIFIFQSYRGVTA